MLKDIPALRFLPRCRHRESGTVWPAMLAAVTIWPAVEPVAIHRTYLRPDGTGKAPVEPAKKTLGPIAGGAVRLAEPGPVLALAEGIETALAFMTGSGLPTWAVLSAGNMARLVLPPLPLAAEIVIAADNDPPGLAAANVAARAFTAQGRRVRIVYPNKAGADFCDALADLKGFSHDRR
jgi:phage/plasmid primase-like uncharacterized protein